MEFRFWQRNRLPKPVKEFMRQRFSLTEEYLGRLRCFQYDGLAKGAAATNVRIFNPRLACRHNIEIKNNADLDANPEVLLFEGYVDVRGNVYMEDKRLMSYPEDSSMRRVLDL